MKPPFECCQMPLVERRFGEDLDAIAATAGLFLLVSYLTVGRTSRTVAA